MKFWCLPLVCLLAGPVAAAENCEALRADIESRIRAAGVSSLSVTIVDADAPAAGQIVGGCDLGRKKIIYERLAGPALPRPATPVLTECRDGSTPVDGRCKK